MRHAKRLAPRADYADGLPGRRFPAIDHIAGKNPRMAGCKSAGCFSVDTNCTQASIIADSASWYLIGAGGWLPSPVTRWALLIWIARV